MGHETMEHILLPDGGVVMVIHRVHGAGKGRDLGRNDVPEGLA